jgi:hypothetical protein
MGGESSTDSTTGRFDVGMSPDFALATSHGLRILRNACN